MNKILTATVSGLVAAMGVESIIAQTGNAPLEEVTVQASRVVTATVERTPAGRTPVTRVSLSYTVTTQGLDLTTPSGAQQFEKRVSDAATAVCKELGSKYPNSTPDDIQCAKITANDAMAKAHQLEAAAAMTKSSAASSPSK